MTWRKSRPTGNNRWCVISFESIICLAVNKIKPNAYWTAAPTHTRFYHYCLLISSISLAGVTYRSLFWWYISSDTQHGTTNYRTNFRLAYDLISSVTKKYGGSARKVPYINLSREDVKSRKNLHSRSSGTDDSNVTSAKFCRRFDSSYIMSVSYKDRLMHTYIFHTALLEGKGKSVPLQAWSGPEGSRKLRFSDFMTMAQEVGKVVGLTYRPPLPPGNAPGTHFC